MGDGSDMVALAGNPNTGKTTLFNALTGANAKVGNYAGATVELKTGETRTPHGHKLQIIDLPGCYSLTDGSPDQQVAHKVLKGEIEELGKPDLVLCVLDASNLERHLNLALEVIEQGLPVIVALNMVDLAESSGIRLDPQKLSEELGVPVVPIQANTGKGIVELKQAIRHPFPAAPESSWLRGIDHSAKERQDHAIALAEMTARRPSGHTSTFSDKLDSFLLHPFFGWVTFVAVMLTVFWVIFSVAEYPMNWVEGSQVWLQEKVGSMMSPGDFRDLIVDGIIGGVGAVVIFLPQILMLFFFIGLLESSGYMSRAAYLLDGVMSKVGLSGKAFLPLFSSYACAIPGVMATRTIDSAKERLVTIFVAPWMSCSARLPVYLLLIPMLLSEKSGFAQALVMTGVYALGTITAFIVARILRGKLGPDETTHHFILELPPYRAPQWSYVFRHLGDRGWAFLKKAGTFILGLMILLWAAETYPKSDSDDPAEQLNHSIVGRISNTIEPAVKPLGFDGRTGTAILTSFAAREVFVGSMALLFQVEEDEDDEELTRERIRKTIAEEKWADGTPMFSTLSVISLLIFYIYALQCLPTSAVVAREAGSWKWAAGQFVFMSLFAYLASLTVYQVGSLMGF